METREKEIVARALEEVAKAVKDAPSLLFSSKEDWIAARLRDRADAIRESQPSPGGARDLYRPARVGDGKGKTYTIYERATKAEAVIEAAHEWAINPTVGTSLALIEALSALDQE
jgi:hypothetical protein